MQKLAEICIRRPVFATVMVLLLVVVGIFSGTHVGLDRFPKVEFPFVFVTTMMTGAAPEEMETEVTDKIEGSVNTISGIEELNSVSAEGMSRIAIKFELSKSVDVAAQEVRDKIAQVRNDLPDDVKEPVVNSFDLDSVPILGIVVTANRPIREITEFTDKVLRRRLENVPGVGQVSMNGGRARRVNVTADPIRLRAYNLTIADLNRALARENVQIPGGTVKGGPIDYTLRTLGRVATVDEIKKLPVNKTKDYSVLVGDVAKVEDGMEDETSYAQFNDTPCTYLVIQKQSGVNVVATVDAIKERLQELKDTFPPGYSVVPVNDQSVFIRASIGNVIEHLILGALLAVVVVLLFLKNIRSTLIAAISIPISIIATFTAVYVMDYTLNIITLLALTLCVGIVVDDAIVVLENIWRWIEKKGKNAHDAAIAGTQEIGLAVLAITISLITVFMPVAFMSGIVGRYMSGFGVTMACAIAFSLFVSFTIVPSLCAQYLKHNPNHSPVVEEEDEGKSHLDLAPDEESGFIFRVVERLYMVVLGFVLHHRWIVLLMCVLALGSLPVLLAKVNKNFIPPEDEAMFSVSIRAPEGTSLDVTRNICRRIAARVKSVEGVDYTVIAIGGDSGVGNVAAISVGLVPMDQRNFIQRDFESYVRDKILPDFVKEYKLRTSIAEGLQLNSDRNASVMYILSGPDMKKLSEYSSAIIDHLKKNVPTAVDVDSSLIDGKPQYGVTINREKAAELGVAVSDIATTLRTLVSGVESSNYNEGGEKYKVWLWAAHNARNTVDQLQLVTVPSRTLGTVPLGDVVNFETGSGPSDIRRFSRMRSVTIYSDSLSTGSEQMIVDEINKKMKDLNMPAEYKGALVGRAKELQRASSAFLAVFIMAICVMYLVLAAQFESWLHPITILLVLPLTVPFAFGAILVFNESMNIMSILGMLVLFSVVKKNAILQVDRTNQLRAAGLPLREAILQANHDRLRPILMTTIAFVAGMIPLFLSQGTGSSTNHTISAVVIGGQTFSLILTLLAVPVAYSYFAQIGESRLWAGLVWVLGFPMRILDNLFDRITSRKK